MFLLQSPCTGRGKEVLDDRTNTYLAISLPSEIFDRCRFSRTKCIYMHFKYLNLTRIKSSKVINFLLDHLSSTMRMCASGVHGLVSVCKATINIKAHWYSYFRMNWPPGSFYESHISSSHCHFRATFDWDLQYL